MSVEGSFNSNTLARAAHGSPYASGYNPMTFLLPPELYKTHAGEIVIDPKILYVSGKPMISVRVAFTRGAGERMWLTQQLIEEFPMPKTRDERKTLLRNIAEVWAMSRGYTYRLRSKKL